MGNLAAAGLLAGLGQGAVMEGEQMDKEKMAHLDLQRELTMAQLKAQYEQEQQGRQFQFEGGQREAQRASEQAMNTERVSHEDARADKELTEKSTQSDKAIAAANQRSDAYIKAKERIAQQNAAARDKPQSRFEFKINSVTPTDAQGVPVVGAAPSQRTVVNDKATGASYVRIGNRFVDANQPNPASVRRAAASEENALMSNPQYADRFIDTYHYLPAQYVESQTQQTFANSGAPVTKAPTTPNGGTGLPAPRPQAPLVGSSAPDASGAESDNGADYAPAVEANAGMP